MEIAAFFAFIFVALLVVAGIILLVIVEGTPERFIDAWRSRGINRKRLKKVERELEKVKQQLRRYERSVTPPRE